MKFCTKCGVQLPDEAKFCTTCGQRMDTPVAEEPAAQEPTVTTPVTEVPVVETPAGEVPAVETPAGEVPTPQNNYEQPPVFMPPVEQPPKKVRKPFNVKKFLLKVCLPIALVAAIVVGVLLSPALGAILKLTSPKSYFTYVENKAFDSYAESITGAYGTALDNFKTDNYGVTSKMTFTIGDDAKALLEDNIPVDIDLDWLSNVSLSLNGSFVDQKISSGIGIMLGDVSIVSLNAIFDYAEKEGYLNLGDLCNKNIKVSLEDAFEDVDMDPSMLSNVMQSAKEVLPSKDLTKKLITKYAKTAYSEFKNIKKSSETVNVENVSQKLTVLTVTIDTHSVMNAVIAVLEDVAKDKDIKDYFYKLMDSDVMKLATSGSMTMDKETMYKQFQAGINSTVADMKEEFAETPKQTIGILYDYVNNSHEIVGRKVEISGRVIADYVTVQKGSDFATNAAIYLDDTINMLGTGKKNGSTITEGTYTFSYDGDQLFEAKVKDLNTKGFEKGEFKGELTLSAGKALIDELPSDIRSAFKLIDPSIQLKFDTNTKSSSIEANVLKGDAVFFGVVITSEMTDATDISVPTDNIVNAEDEDDMMALLEDINIDTLKSRLKQAGVPTELINLLDSIGGQQKVPAMPDTSANAEVAVPHTSFGTGTVVPDSEEFDLYGGQGFGY